MRMVSPFEGPSGMTISFSWDDPAGVPTAWLMSAAVNKEQADTGFSAAKLLQAHTSRRLIAAPQRIFMAPSYYYSTRPTVPDSAGGGARRRRAGLRARPRSGR